MIAEAWARRMHLAAFINKIDAAMGEAMAAQAWLGLALDAEYFSPSHQGNLDDSWRRIGAVLNHMIQRTDDLPHCQTLALPAPSSIFYPSTATHASLPV